MDQTECLPKMFALSSRSHSYYNPDGMFKIYTNIIYNNLGVYTNIISPMQYIQLCNISYPQAHGRLMYTVIRKYDATHYKGCEWVHLGYELKIKDMLNREYIIPVVKFQMDNHQAFVLSDSPIYSFQEYPNIPIKYQGIYTPADIVETDPRTNVRSVGKPITSTSIYPTHIKNIILTDAISKNEYCPILSEPITMKNGEITSCGHIFIKEAIHQWLTMRTTCPICKQDCYI